MVKLRFVELEPDRIFNWLDPKNITAWNAYPELHDTWWESDTVAIREEFGKLWTAEFDKITGHFTKLEESILKKGVQFPINCVTGHPRDMYLTKPVNIMHFPPETHLDIEDTIYSHTFGGSRLTIAKKHNFPFVPCVVHDFSNIFEDYEEITSNNFKDLFGNNYSFANSTPYLRLLQHSHMDDEKYNGMNNNTRTAQTEAVKKAKEIINV